VLRGYRCGGLAARVSRDAYVWQGEARTRGLREYRLLAHMREQGLAVPASLLDEPAWEAVARAIAAMHRAGVWHADLNAFNILLDPGGLAWLIDFDRGTAGGVSERGRQGNLARLRRSLVKVGGERGQDFWQRLGPAYRAAWARGTARA
ncbi:lipopolysaccharide kinase InaA family protein, partial [Bordetella pertussis]|uniref:lipopolysaccharide kinase InaA family protein n=1 Tax=Bordetella pertussis TaxID=520 RepID=UPI000AB2A6D7